MFPSSSIAMEVSTANRNGMRVLLLLLSLLMILLLVRSIVSEASTNRTLHGRYPLQYYVMQSTRLRELEMSFRKREHIKWLLAPAVLRSGGTTGNMIKCLDG
jgi:hypothetical protein